MANFLKMENVQSVSYQDGALSQFNLTMKKNEINVLLGTQASGKTRVLRAIAGLDRIVEGKIVLKGNHISTPQYMVPVHQRECSYIAKDPLLFPHLTVSQNIQLPMRSLSRRSRHTIVDQVLKIVNLEGYGRYPTKYLPRAETLRVALARALVLEPSLILINNPFVYQIASEQLNFISELRKILIDHDITALFAMNEKSDAFSCADKIGIMHDNKLLQWDTPYNIYHHPQHRRTVQFIGEGLLLNGHIQSTNTMSTELGTLKFENKSSDITIGMKIKFLLYPDDLTYSKRSANKGIIVRKEFQGATTNYTLQLSGGSRAQCICPSHLDLNLGRDFGFKVSMDHLIVFKQESDSSIDLAAANST